MIYSVHIVGSKQLGGAELFFKRLVNALHERAQPVLAITVPGSAIARELLSSLPQVHIAMRGAWDPLARWQIRRTLNRRQPDIVQTYMGRATRLTHLPSGRRPVHVARLGGYYNLKGYRHAHAWVGNSKGICDYLISNGFPASRIAHISNFVTPPRHSTPEELAEQRRGLMIPDEALVIVAVGRLHPVKGFEDLLKAFATIPSHIHERPVYLVIVGDGPLRKALEQYAVELAIDTRVRWAGWQQEPGRFYELADLFVCPSRYEGLGGVLLEAWAYRRAVLSTTTAGPSEIATHEETAWLTPVENPSALAKAMVLLLENDSLREKLASNGYRTVLNDYSPNTIVKGYLDFYQALLRG